MARVVFPPVGHCIYCGATDGRLTMEHIVASGLGGDLELPKASCDVCQKITSRIERYCLRQTFMHIRARDSHPTRRPSNRPKEFPVKVRREDGTLIRETIKAEELPNHSWFLPVFGPCGFVLQVAPDKVPGPDVRFQVGQEGIGKIPPKEECGGLYIEYESPELNVLIFSRMLAKIGLSYAYAKLGSKGFRPKVRHLVVNDDPVDWLYWVGGERELPAPESTKYSLKIRMNQVRGQNYSTVRVDIRLFGYLGTPQYHVVVGEQALGRLNRSD